jgi:hypothetical protein
MHEFVDTLKDEEEEIIRGPTFPGCLLDLILKVGWRQGQLTRSGSDGYVVEKISQF